MVSDKSFRLKVGTLTSGVSGCQGQGWEWATEDLEEIGQSAFPDGNWKVHRYSSSSVVPRVLGDPTHSGNVVLWCRAG